MAKTKKKAKRKAPKKKQAKKSAKKKVLTPKQAEAIIKKQADMAVKGFTKILKDEIKDFNGVKVEHQKNLKMIKDMIAQTKKKKIIKVKKLKTLVRRGKDVNLNQL